VTIPQLEDFDRPNEPPFHSYLEASQAIGLDFTPWAGQEVQLRTYFLGHEPNANLKVYGTLLVEGQRVVGAWVSVRGQAPGLHPLNTRREELVRGKTPFVALLEKYGWTPEGEPTVQPVTIPQLEDLNRPNEPPFNLYLEASQAIGLDFTSWAGQEVQLRTYFLGREPTENLEVYGHLLVDGQRFLGAWVSVEGQEPSVHPLNTDIKNLVLSSP